MQNYTLSLFLLLIIFLPFTLGRNILEIVLLSKNDIYGFSLFDITYYLPFYVSDLLIILLFQIYISKKLSGKTEAFKIPKDYIFDALFLAAFILSTFFRSINHQFGQLLFFASLYLIRYLLIFLLPFIVNAKKFKTEIYHVIVAGTLFQSLYVIFEQLKGGESGRFIESRLPGFMYGIRSSESIDVFRANGTFNEPNITAIFLAINLSIILFNFFKTINDKKYKINLPYIFLILLNIAAIILTGSRSITLVAFFVLIYFLFTNLNAVKLIFKELSQKIIVKIFIAVSVVLIIPYLVARVDNLNQVTSESGSLSYRFDLNSHSLMLSNYSFQGIGIDMTPYYLAKTYKTADANQGVFDPAPAHNIFIQIITEEGTLGLILFLIFIYFALGRGFKNYRKMPAFYIAALVYLISAQFHPAFTTHPEIFAFFILYLGLAKEYE